MSLYVVSPRVLTGFTSAFDKACETGSGWADFCPTLGKIHPHWSPNSSSPSPPPESLLTSDLLHEAIVPDSLPNADSREVIFRQFARWTAAYEIPLNETKVFERRHWLPEEKPVLASSAEWRLFAECMLSPGRIPESLWFLEADRDYATACVMSPDEALGLLASEREERLLETGVLFSPHDSRAILGAIHLAATYGWPLWHHEVS